jgi:hypothetical protein
MTLRGRNAAIAKLATAPILALSLLLPPCEPFTPCPAPRFDDFGEALVGRWGNLRKPNDYGGFLDAIHGKEDERVLATGVVEEVMRSCGGAVQGVRETDGVYLNRADDGFVYFPDGSYSSGPTSLGGEQASLSGRQDPQGATTCLCFGTTRFMFDTPLLFYNSGIHGRTCAKHPEVLVKFGWSDTPEDVTRSIVQAMRQIANDDPRPDVDNGRDPGGPRRELRVTREVQCRMPTRGQSWMLPRAQWEQRVEGSMPKDTTTSGDALRENDSKRCSTQSSYWVDLTLGGGGGCTLVRNEGDLVQSSPSKDDAFINVLQVGVEFQGSVKALSRIYHPEGGLEKVVWTEGIS